MTKLDKDPAIIAAIDRLLSLLGPDAFVVADHWEQDLCAVGIASTRDASVLAYISTYGESPDRFGYELELPPLPGDEIPHRVASAGSGLTIEELASVIAKHLESA